MEQVFHMKRVMPIGSEEVVHRKSAELLLVRAMVERAWGDLRTDYVSAKDRLEAQAWVDGSLNPHGFFSFENCCELLGLDVEATRIRFALHGRVWGGH